MYRGLNTRFDCGAGIGIQLADAGIGYEITQPSRSRRAYGLIRGPYASADRHLTQTVLTDLREICRVHDRNSALFSGIINLALNNIFGSSFDFVPGTSDPLLNKQVKGYIKKRMASTACDATGNFDFTEIAKTSMRAVWNDGDCLLVKQKDGSILPFESDQIISPKNKSNGVRFVNGVELNSVNRPLAYWVKQRRTQGDYAGIKIDDESKRVQAKYVFYPAYKTRFNQTRGVPFLAAILKRFDRVNNYIDYESLAAEINSMQTWKITRQLEDINNPLEGTEDSDDTASTYDKVQKVEPGQIYDLAVGEDFAMVGSQRPGDNFEPYLINSLRVIGVGIGLPLELILLDFSRTNYSSARASLAEARRMFRSWQRFAQNKICIPWYNWQIARAIALRILPPDNRLFIVRCQWPAWEYIDPVKEALGNRIAREENVKSRSQIIRESGEEPEEVFREIQEENKLMATIGLTKRKSDDKRNKIENKK